MPWCHMRKCKKNVFPEQKMVLEIVVFPCKIAEHHLGHDGFRSFFYANPEVGASKWKICGAEPRKAHLLKLWCVMCDNQKLLQLSWMDGLCSPKFPTCSQTAVILVWTKRFNGAPFGGLFSKKTFYSLLQSKEKLSRMPHNGSPWHVQGKIFMNH